MKDQILQTLKDLRAYALGKDCDTAVFLHEEDSCLMRFANSAISLNTNEHLVRIDFVAYQGRKRAEYELITDLSKLDEMRYGIDTAAEMVKHAQPLSYDPTVPVLAESFVDESGYDPKLAGIGNEERLAYFNHAVKGLETDDIKLSGIFSNGSNTVAQINTRSDHTQYFRTSDAQVAAVLSHTKLKWEVMAEQSAYKQSELDASALRRELNWLLACYQKRQAFQLPLGSYDIVFGPAAISELVSTMNWIGFNGGSMKRGFSFIGEGLVGKKVFSDKVTLIDDPTRLETFPYKRDFTGIVRNPFPLIEKGVFKSFAWFQDDADEFGAKPSGHTVMHKSLVLSAGQGTATSLEQLVGQSRETDLLYIPHLHYMNIVNPSKGIITASSRFGALLLRKDGSVVVPYNVRITQSLLDLFGEKVAWMSKEQVVHNTSMSYGPRNPTSVIVPKFIQVNAIEISHSNTSY